MATLAGPALAQVIGASLARPVARLRALSRELRAHKEWSEARLAALEDAIEETHRISLRSQQLGRLAEGRLRQSHERLALHSIVLDLLVQRQAAFKRRQISLQQHLKPVEVIVDPGLLVGLLEALIDWAADAGDELQVRLEMKNWPEHGLLTLRAIRTSPAPAGANTQETNGVAWQLITHTARLMGLTLKRELAASSVQVTLEFSRTVRQLSGLTAMDADRGVGPGSAQEGTSQGHQLTGLRMLLVSDDMRLRRDAAHLCKQANMSLDLASHSRQAVELSELSPPGVIIIDESLHDPFLGDYLERLTRERPHVRVIEVTNQDTALEIASWEGGSRSRIGRGAVREHLKAVLAFELER